MALRCARQSLLAEQDPAMVHPQDLSQGRFWVAPTGKLNGESSRSASNR